MRIIAFVSDANTIQKILGHIGESTQPPTISPAHEPPLWESAKTAKEMDTDHRYEFNQPHRNAQDCQAWRKRQALRSAARGTGAQLYVLGGLIDCIRSVLSGKQQNAFLFALHHAVCHACRN